MKALAIILLTAGAVCGRARVADAQLAAVDRLVATLESHHAESGRHVWRVGEYASFLARRLGLPPTDLARARLAGRIHDVGKTAVPVVLLDKPGKPTAEEWAQLKQHPARGAQMAEAAGIEAAVVHGARAHHERWDGAGYPARLKGESIPRIARIVSVADTWDAVTSQRSYQKARPFAEAMKVLRDAAGAQLDPAMVDAFLADEPALHKLHDAVRGR